MKSIRVILSVAIPLAALAASNPEVVLPECDQRTVAESCGGVTPPVPGEVFAVAGCTNFAFRIEDPLPGRERIDRREVWYGGANCPEPKDLEPRYRDLVPEISWSVVSGGVTNRGTGAVVSVPRADGVCRASCTFELTVSPSLCPPPAPVTVTAEVVFADAVSLRERETTRLCCLSSDHAPHLFDLDGCDAPVLSVVPADAATVVSLDGRTAHVKGLRPFEDAQAVATAACGAATNLFDVVGLGDFAVTGLCGCRSASDATDSDSDAPTAETMDLGADATGFSLALGVEPVRWAGDARWRVTGPDGWMPNAGSFADDGQRTFAVRPEAFPAVLDAWFDCERDLVRGEDEPKRRVTGTIARLGELKVEREQTAEGAHGPTNRCDESFAPDETAVFTNSAALPAGRSHVLRVVRTLPRYKDKAMTIPLGPVPGGGNSWRLKIPADCGDGLFWVELTDPLHSCTSIVKRLCVQACLCSSCEEFAKETPENGCIDVAFGLGRTSSGGGKAPVRFVLERTDALPDIASESAPDGRMDVSSSNGVMTVAFTRTGEQVPVAVYTLTPGACAFTMRETRNGSLRKTAVWTHADGVWTMEVFDETVAPRELLRRDVRTTRATARGAVHTLARGVESVETETEEIDGIGPVAVRETRGTGADARTTWKSYYASGAAKGRVRSELFPDGSWTMYTYDATGRVETVVAPFGDSSPALDDRNAVIGYNGAVRRTTYSYASVDGRDDGMTLADEPRTIVESVGSDAAGWREVSRRYAAHFVADGVRVEVSERAASPGAAYGAAGNQRTISTYLWSRRGAGRPVRRETPDGLVATWAYDFTPSNVVVETMTVPSAATNGIPFKTTVERTVEDLRGDVLREETYIVTDSGRELFSWTDFERDAAGHELRRESSDGSLVERAWSCCGPEWEMDERGIVTVYSYDALGRQATMTRSGVTTLWNYDLAGNTTNVTRFADALMASSATGYDSAGRLVWNVGEDGVRTEYAYSTSPEGGEVRTTIQAAGTNCAMTNTVLSFRDGSTKASYLNGILKSTEVHELFASATYEGTNGLASARWTRSETDFLGRTISESRPGFGGSTLVASNLYDSAGRLASSESMALGPENIKLQTSNVKLFLYDNLNDRVAAVDDRNFNNSIDWTGPDLVSSNLTHYVKLDGYWWRETKSYSIYDDNSAVARLMGVHRSRVTGLGANGLASESVSIDQRGNATTNRLFRNRVAAEDIAWVKYPTSTTPAVTVSTNGLVRSSTSQTGVTTTFAYDAFQREVSQTDGRGNTMHTVYDSLGRVASTIDALGYATAYGYDALGRQISVIDPLTNTVTTAYDAEGRVLSQRGATYPVDYAYDEFGDKISMTTYRDINAAGDVTRWLRDEATGLVTNKVYADGKGPRYDYTPDGKLATRTWARGIVTTYSYDDNGSLTNTVYSDGTPTISLAYNRAGQQTRAEDAAGVTTFLYDDFGAVTNETVIGVAGTNTIERFYDSFGRDAGYALNGVRQSTLAYDPATGSLVSISDAVANTEYSYSSDLLDTGYTLTLSNGEVLCRSVIRDERCRLLVTGIVSLENGNSIDSFTYAYDVLSRPTQRNCDTFCYNDRSEVTSATIAAEEPYLTSTFYGYDDIGNLTMSTSNSGSSSFAANGLNQYTSICSDFASLCEPTYDIDGNMLSNGDITFAYDSKSRLVAAAGQNGEYIVSNRYDHLDRRVQKVTPAATHSFFYDGWMLIKEIVANTNGTTDVVEYHWGKDLSGTIGGAGGVGGLLYLKRNGAIYVPWYDAYGNIVGYWDAQGNVVAEYTYDAFGKLISSNGPMADVFAIRYSTKYFDPETGLYYYGYRFYSPELMRWISRDPIGEEGGVNLYTFCENSPVDAFDEFGLWTATSESAGQSRRVYKFEDGDTLESLAKIVRLDSKEWQNWALSEKSAVADKTTASKIANASKPGCYVSVPNVWISADLLRGGNWYYDLFVNQGGTIGRFVGTDIFTSSNYKIVKADDVQQLSAAFRESKGNIWGIVVFGHGSKDGALNMSSSSLAPTEEGITWTKQDVMIDALSKGGYKISKAYMMQCYSAYKGMNKEGDPVDYDSAWRKVAVKFYGYKGVNAFGIDFGNKSKKHRRHGRRH